VVAEPKLARNAKFSVEKGKSIEIVEKFELIKQSQRQILCAAQNELQREP
jgi:hypothetical protein